MRRRSLSVLLVAAAVAAAATAASAADLPAPAPAYYPPAPAYQPAIYNWTGGYIGVQGGVNALDDNFVNTATTALQSEGVNSRVGYFGLIGGVRGGADFQWGPMVVGVAGDWLATNLTADALATTLSPGITQQSSTRGRWYATATGRIGYAMNSLLVYGKGGVAWARQDYGEDILAAGLDVSTQTIAGVRFGFTVGGGLEYELLEHVSLFLEYDFLDFGTKDYVFDAISFTPVGAVPGTPATVNPLPIAITDYIHELMFGVNYRFN